MTHNLVDHLDENWQRTVADVRAAVAALWQRPAHRYAVDHGPGHADRVVTLLGGLTEGLMNRAEYALAAQEIYVLLAAAHLHAIGLQDEQNEPDPQARWARYPGLGAEMIYRAAEMPDKAAHLGLVGDPGLVEMVALVVAGHRLTQYPSPDYDDFGVRGARLRPRLLAALLHLAAALDLDYSRVDLEQLKLMQAEAEQALDWWLHHYVSSVEINDENIQISYRLPRGEEAYAILVPELLESQLRAAFRVLHDVFRLYGVKPAIAPSSVRPMRTVQPMPPTVWAEAQRRLARLKGNTAEPIAKRSPLVEKVQGLLSTMGYDCGPPACDDGPLTCFHCRPRGGGLRPPLVVGCKAGPVEVADVEAVAARFQAPDQQGYVVAETRVLSSAQGAAQTSGRVRVFTLAGFYHELLDFRAYVASLVDDYRESELARYYVDLGCVRYSYDERGQVVSEDRFKPMDAYLDRWLKEKDPQAERNHISILGDYGTGKTSFCRQYAAKQGRRWLSDPDGERVPILINLRDYTKTLKVSSLITEALVNQYGIQGATFEAFTRYNADRKLLILFDGFDEMAQRTGLRTAVDNFWELAEVVVPGSKVVLTCRTPYFRTHHEAERLLRGQEPPLSPPRSTGGKHHTSPPLVGGIEGGPPKDYIDLRNRPNFEIVHLEPFSDADVQAVLRARFPNDWQAHWDQIQRIYNLPDLARRPVLLDMISCTLSRLKEGETLNAARLYQVYTDTWLEREVRKGRTLITPADRRLFAEELAMEMLRAEELNIHYSRIPGRVKAHFCLDKAEEIDHFEADVRTCNFMARDEAGHYAFAHKSFMEFFAASRLHQLTLEDQATVGGPLKINEEVRIFLRDLFALQPKPEPDVPISPPAGFVWVPPGEFVLGGRGGFDLQIARLEHGFFAAKTPLTNAEFARFIEDGGYNKREYWTEGGWKRKENDGWEHPRYWKDAQWNGPSQPVVGVSWYEAVAYCNWLATTTGWRFRLPTEQEWEKAARGYDGREYPWSDREPTHELCNFSVNVGKTTPVGQYSPQGDSPYGLQDAAGNVWEWTASDSGSYKVLRGGGWDDYQSDIRSAYRIDSAPPFDRSDYVGFRCVGAPGG